MEQLLNITTDQIEFLFASCGEGSMSLSYKTINGILVTIKPNNPSGYGVENRGSDFTNYPIDILYDRIWEFTSLTELVIDSCSKITIPRIPKTLKYIKLSHEFFNPELFDMIRENKGSIYISMCCHFNYPEVNYRLVSDMQDAKKRSPSGDPHNCIYCYFDGKTQCPKCNRCMVLKDNSNVQFYDLLNRHDPYDKLKELHDNVQAVCPRCLV
jgi:hypothetical protein